MGTAFSFLFPYKKIIVLFFLGALIVAYTRISLGVHYPTDVLSGIVIGSTEAIVTFYASKLRLINPLTTKRITCYNFNENNFATLAITLISLHYAKKSISRAALWYR
jgi:membrane-associated phospholipid phosphatase